MDRGPRPPDPDIQIRVLGYRDADQYAVLRAEALELHPLAFGSGPACDLKELGETFRTHIADASRVVACGAFVGDELVGAARLYRQVGVKEAHKCEIVGMYVAAAHRKRGIGGALLRELMNHARSWSGVTHVHISVTDAAPQAARLYEREGFRLWGTEPAALRFEGRCVSEHHMVLVLTT